MHQQLAIPVEAKMLLLEQNRKQENSLTEWNEQGDFYSLMRMRWDTGLVGNGSETGSTRLVDEERIVSHGNI